jgi:glycerophosphoryl diester phosphodiesterase
LHAVKPAVSDPYFLLEVLHMTSPLPAWPYSPYIAHRGGGHLAPENTLAAMHVGAAQGFTMFEFDVKLSRDNIAILMHDDDVDRSTDGSGPARDKT